MAATAAGDVREELSDILLSFIEVAVHSLLFVRQVYPPSVFEKRKEFGVGVWMSRHPTLNASISGALAAAKPAMLRSAVESIVLVILDARGAGLEQYAFDVATSLPDDVVATYRCAEERGHAGAVVVGSHVQTLVRRTRAGTEAR